MSMDLSSPRSPGLRGAMYITAAELECFYGEHLLFQGKCIQQAKSILSAADHNLSGRLLRREGSHTARLSHLLLDIPRHLLHPGTAEPTSLCFPHLYPKRELQTAVSVPERELP